MRSLVAALVLALCASAAHAGDCDVTFSSVGDDFADLIASPFHMDQSETIKTLGFAAAVGSSMIWFDDDFDRAAHDHPNAYPYAIIHHVARPASWYGESDVHALITAAVVTGAVGLGGWIAYDDYTVQTSAIMAESVVFTFGITTIGKMIFGRARPYADEGPHSFHLLTAPGHDANISFPSGHASAAWALAGAAAIRHPHWYVQVPAYSFAVSAALQRVDVRKHWMSDVIAGSVLGYAVSKFLADRHTCPPGAAGSGAVTPTLAVSFSF